MPITNDTIAQQRAQCLNTAKGPRRRPKRRYEAPEDAQAHLAALLAKGDDVHVYWCEFCGGYHVGRRRR